MSELEETSSPESSPEASPSSSVPAEKEKPSDNFKAKHKAVFAFDEVKIKSAGASGLEQGSEKCSNEDVLKFRGKESMFREEEDVSKFKGKESIQKMFKEEEDRGFKKPSRPGSRPYEPPRNRRVPYDERGSRGRGGKRSVPDFRVNPDKYTKYSLADVDLPTNTSNSQAAFAFLDEVRKRKAGGSGEEEARVEEGAKFTFKKPTKKHAGREKVEDCEADGASTSSEDGAKKKNKDSVKEKAKSGKKSKQMALSHLMDEDEEDDE